MTLARPLLFSTALIALMAGSALADDNFSNVVQDGADNSGVIVQGPGDRNKVGADGLAALQDGDRNTLDIEQAGSDNEVGTRGSGLNQAGNENVLVIDQTSDGNRVNQIVQTSGGGAVTRNSATVVQRSAAGEPADGRSTVTSLVQTHQSGPANDLTITQTSEGPGGNTIGIGGRASVRGGVTQSGGGNVAVLTQTGDGNRIRESLQTGQRNALAVSQNGSDNLAEATQEGNRNGAADLGGFDDFVGLSTSVSQGLVEQTGVGNTARLDLTGNRNQFGIAQIGSSNTALGRANGDANQFALSQSGDSNLGRIRIGDRGLGVSDRNLVVLNQDSGLSFGNEGRVRVDGNANEVALEQFGVGAGNFGLIDIVGDRNAVGVRQLGSNAAETFLSGNANTVGLDQAGTNDAMVGIAGNLNRVDAAQFGGLGGNSLAVSISGNRNGLDIQQTNTAIFGGPLNTIDVSIHGSRNNEAAGFTPGWTSAQMAGSLVPGQLVQIGSGNSIALDVGTSLDPNSNANLFAFSQIGNGNGIDGQIVGTSNEVAIVQAGSNNFTSFSQIGNFNSIGVNQ